MEGLNGINFCFLSFSLTYSTSIWGVDGLKIQKIERSEKSH